jgi:hypothetical protein
MMLHQKTEKRRKTPATEIKLCSQMHHKKWTRLAKFPLLLLFRISISGSYWYPKYKRFVKCLLSHLVYSQIWLNLLVDDCKFGYITKLAKKYFKSLIQYPLLIISHPQHGKGGLGHFTHLYHR